MSPEYASRPLRSDAARSRARVIAAAAEVFSRGGLDVGYDEIARVAGVGVGTVYRRFPNKDELYEAVLTSTIDRVLEFAAASRLRDDSWEALTWFFELFLVEQRGNLGLAQLVARGELTSPQLTRRREELIAAVDGVIDRAQRSGTARQDVAGLDFVVVLTLVVRIAAAEDSDLWRRYFALFLDCLRGEPTRNAPPGPTPTIEGIERLFGRL